MLRGFAALANLTLPTGRIVLGGGPAWDSGAGAGAGAGAGTFNAKLSIETPVIQTVGTVKPALKNGALTLGGVRHLVDPDQAVADFEHVIPKRPSEQRNRIVSTVREREEDIGGSKEAVARAVGHSDQGS